MKLIIFIVLLILLIYYYNNSKCINEKFSDTFSYFDKFSNPSNIQNIDIITPVYSNNRKGIPPAYDPNEIDVYADKYWTIKPNLTTDIFNESNNDQCTPPYVDPNWNTEIFSCNSGTTQTTTSKSLFSHDE